MPPASKPKPSPRQAIQDGVAFQKAGNLLQAAQIYSGLIRDDPTNADAWHLLGTIEIGRGNFDAAHDMIGQALRIQPGAAIFHHNMAYVLSAQSRMDESVAAYRKAVELAPDYAEAHFNLSQSVRVAAGDPLIAAVERLCAKPDLSDRDRCFIEFAAGKILCQPRSPRPRLRPLFAAGNAARKAQ